MLAVFLATINSCVKQAMLIKLGIQQDTSENSTFRQRTALQAPKAGFDLY
jgi:hypothetical protein